MRIHTHPAALTFETLWLSSVREHESTNPSAAAAAMLVGGRMLTGILSTAQMLGQLVSLLANRKPPSPSVTHIPGSDLNGGVRGWSWPISDCQQDSPGRSVLK